MREPRDATYELSCGGGILSFLAGSVHAWRLVMAAAMPKASCPRRCLDLILLGVGLSCGLLLANQARAASSQPPSPAWTISDRQPPEDGTSGAKKQAAPDAPIAPEPGPEATSPNAQQDTAAQTSKIDGKAAADWSLVYLTALLVIIGFIQAAMAIWQGYLLRQTGRDGLRTAKQQRELAKLLIETEEAKLRESTAADGPILVIAFGYAEPAATYAEVAFLNIGATPCVIEQKCLDLLCATTLPAVPEYGTPSIRKAFRDEVLMEDERLSVRKEGILITPTEWQTIAGGENKLWLFGYVDFLDFQKVRWREGFAISVAQARGTEPGQVIVRGPDAYNFCRRHPELAGETKRKRLEG